ncbi:helix-turn-helix domain-containing protein [Bacillus tuaregi]|uniref:hypothetical protein n=1 Tax=Bacillus tuaregi TaxID=1816695 RepID=UPI0008F91F9B|nr:hypothetical protein [Bacillus tuaregi]
MNYVQEMSSFYNWLKSNPLSPSAITLWHGLMHMQNQAGGSETFSVSETVLCVKTNISGRTIRKARQELQEKGRLNFVSKQGKSAFYQMIPFHAESSSPTRQQPDQNAVEKNPSVQVEKEEKEAPACKINSDFPRGVTVTIPFCVPLLRQLHLLQLYNQI